MCSTVNLMYQIKCDEFQSGLAVDRVEPPDELHYLPLQELCLQRKFAWRAVRLLSAEWFPLLHLPEADNRGSSWLAIDRSCGNNKIVTCNLQDVLWICRFHRAIDKWVCGAADMIACCSLEL